MSLSKREVWLMMCARLEAASVFEGMLEKWASVCWDLYEKTPKRKWITRRRLLTRHAVFFKMWIEAYKYSSEMELPEEPKEA